MGRKVKDTIAEIKSIRKHWINPGEIGAAPDQFLERKILTWVIQELLNLD